MAAQLKLIKVSVSTPRITTYTSPFTLHFDPDNVKPSICFENKSVHSQRSAMKLYCIQPH